MLTITTEKVPITPKQQPPEYEPVWSMVIGQLNKAAAVCMTLGSAYALHYAWGTTGGIVGFIGGALAAVITCGTVAILLDIRQCLQESKGNGALS